MATSRTVLPSGNPDIDALLEGSRWTPGTLTYSFPTSATAYSYRNQIDAEPGNGFQPFNDVLKAAAARAFAIYSEYANLTFSPSTSNSADLRLARADFDAEGTAYFPDSPGGRNGDLFLNGDYPFNDTSLEFTTLPQGDSGFTTLMHEIGHTLGLSHQTLAFDDPHTGWDYSIMSYASYPGLVPQGDPPTIFQSGQDHPETPMLADVAALQYMYGANFNTRSSNTVYQWATNGELIVDGVGQGIPENRKIYMTIWDGGGTDTYDFSNWTETVHVDLRPGEFSTPGLHEVVDSEGHASLTSNVLPTLYTIKTTLPNNTVHQDAVHGKGSIANAFLFNGDTRSLIENAIGGSGDDLMIGNQANNNLQGGEGDDTLFYTGGVDTFSGGTMGTSGDTADFSLSPTAVVINPVAAFRTLMINGHPVSVQIPPGSLSADALGNKYEVTTNGGTTIATLTGIENLTGSRFADTITGDTGNNIIKAGNSNDRVFYTGGYDDIDGGSGSGDTIDFSKFGFAVLATLTASTAVSEAYTADAASIPTGAGLRRIAELSNFENIVGTAYADVLAGNSAANTLTGGAGPDQMSGQFGNDTYFVDDTGDTVTETSSLGGNDSVISSVSFTLGAFVENLTLTGFSSLSGTGNSLANEIIGNAAGNTLSGLDGDDTLEGRGGNDTVLGGLGNDTYVFTGASLANDTFIDSGGTDTVLIDSFSDLLSTSRVGNDLLVTLETGSFRIKNHFAGGAIEFLTDGVKTVVLATGTIGGDASGIISGTNGDDVLDGRGGDDFLFGGGGKDTLIGGLGNDRIEGGNGRDIIDGGAGDDLLIGGGGRDTFVFRPASQDGGAGHDTILHFSENDVLDLRAFHIQFGMRGHDQISVSIDHGDTVITLGDSSIRLEDFTHLRLDNLLL